jgi:CHAT domain-containing protein
VEELADGVIQSHADLAAEIVGLGGEVRQDLISLAQARRSAKALAAIVNPSAVAEVEEQARRELRVGNYQSAMVIADLLESAAAASGAPAEISCWWRAAMLVLSCAPRALAELPDGRVYRRSLAMARSLLAAANERQDRDAMGQALLQIALLHVDSFTVGKNPVGYEQQHTFWVARMVRELGHAVGEHPDSAVAMPAPQDALLDGLAAAAAAADLLEGGDQGLALATEATALFFLDSLGAPADRGDVDDVLWRAARMVQPDRQPTTFSGVIDMLARRGADVRAGVQALGHLTADELVDRHGRAEALLILSRLASVAQRIGSRAISDRAIADALHLASTAGADEARRFVWATALHFHGAGLVDCGGPVYDIKARMGDLRRECDAQGWEPERLGAALLHLVAHSAQGAESGLEVLASARELAPRLWQGERGMAARYLHAVMLMAVGGTAVEAGDWTAATGRLGDAAAEFADLELREQALKCCEDLRYCAGRGTPEAAMRVFAEVEGLMVDLEDRFGDQAARSLLRANRTATERLLDAEVSGDFAFAQNQLAKGLWFALGRSQPGAFPADETQSELLGQVMRAERELRDQADSADPPVMFSFDDEDLVSACLVAGEGMPGRDAAERLSNQKRIFDAHLTHRLRQRARAAAVRSDGRPSLQMIQRRLGDRTVLLDIVLGSAKRGEQSAAATLVYSITSGDLDRVVISTPNAPGLVSVYHEQQRLLMYPIAWNVAQLRRELQQEQPDDHRVVSRAAEQILTEETEIYLGQPIVEQLARWRAEGRDHLAIWPHGPLRFLPFHLLHAQGRPLADDWNVTYLPDVGMLARSPERPEPRGRGRVLVVAAPDGGVAFGLEREDSVVNQATAVANFAGTSVESTKAALLRALPNSRRIHIAAHGAHDTAAPALQCIYLSAGLGEDGRLFAYEVLEHDLRHVDLITLSACESALGRVDVADNLLGIPAALFLAGVLTVIGCLWPVGPEVARTFFTALYARLSEGVGKLGAFRAAQLQARERHPLYCDWGAFCFMGDWRGEENSHV